MRSQAANIPPYEPPPPMTAGLGRPWFRMSDFRTLPKSM